MKARHLRRVSLGAMAAGFLLAAAALLGPAWAQAPATKPNILFIMGDDIGWMQVGVYHHGLALGETPNIDRIGQEDAVFTDNGGPLSGLLLANSGLSGGERR